MNNSFGLLKVTQMANKRVAISEDYPKFPKVHKANKIFEKLPAIKITLLNVFLVLTSGIVLPSAKSTNAYSTHCPSSQ